MYTLWKNCEVIYLHVAKLQLALCLTAYVRQVYILVHNACATDISMATLPYIQYIFSHLHIHTYVLC